LERDRLLNCPYVLNLHKKVYIPIWVQRCILLAFKAKKVKIFYVGFCSLLTEKICPMCGYTAQLLIKVTGQISGPHYGHGGAGSWE